LRNEFERKARHYGKTGKHDALLWIDRWAGRMPA
jgi:hypothetical protein